MIGRILGLFVLAYVAGFALFVALLPGPMEGGQTDAIVVPTGGAGRIMRGLELLERGNARAMLVTGVDTEVKPREFAAEFRVPAATMHCCVTLGFAAVDTRSNAAETAAWIRQRNFKSLRLVTTDWHMRRAASELSASLPRDIIIVEDAVHSRPRLAGLFLEYNKLLASWLARMIER